MPQQLDHANQLIPIHRLKCHAANRQPYLDDLSEKHFIVVDKNTQSRKTFTVCHEPKRLALNTTIAISCPKMMNQAV